MKKLIAFILSLVGAYFVATPVGKWFVSKYVAGGFIHVGPFPGYDQGFLFGYIFFAALLLPLFTKRLIIGLYFALPVIIFDLLHPTDPQLWIDLVLLAIGLGLAWLIMFIRNQVRTTKSN